MNDWELVIKLLKSLKSDEKLDLSRSHDEIVNRAIHDASIDKVIKVVEGIKNGTINLKDIQ